MSTMSCIPASILPNAPLYPARDFNKLSVCALSGNSGFGSCRDPACFPLSMISRHSCTHSSQMKTPGPATSVFTSFCDFPQKEQLYTRLRVWLTSASCTTLLHVNDRLTVNHKLTNYVNLTLTRP